MNIATIKDELIDALRENARLRAEGERLTAERDERNADLARMDKEIMRLKQQLTAVMLIATGWMQAYQAVTATYFVGEDSDEEAAPAAAGRGT